MTKGSANLSKTITLGRILCHYFKTKKPFYLNDNNEWVLNKTGHEAFLKFKSALIDANIVTGEQDINAILIKLDEIANIDLYEEKSK